MRVLIIDIDSTIPNFALKKLEIFHRAKGDHVEFTPMFESWADRIYASCVFDWNRDKAAEWARNPKAIVGGTGWDIKAVLPPEIEEIKPRINWGFTTRGCIRRCKFCKVPEKEGGVRPIGDIYDIWDGRARELVLSDNNILALPQHFKRISGQIKKEKLRVDFNQGLDHRLLTEESAAEVLSLKYIEQVRFAFDDIRQKSTVLKALKILKAAGLKDWKSRWYIYIGERDTFDSVYDRLQIIREHKQFVYIMRDRKIYDNPLWIALASWGNMLGAFKIDLRECIEKLDRMKGYRGLIERHLRRKS